MADGFYQTNCEVLKFILGKDLDKINFNHYISKKENLQRINSDLPRGQFYISINSISTDLNVTVAVARGLIKKFIKLGIISNVYTPPKGCKKPSIWKYNAVFTNNDDNNEENNDINNDINNEKHSKLSGLEVACSNEKNNDTNNEKNNEGNTSKKENKKENLKRRLNNNNKGYDAILNSYTENQELKNTVIEFIKMRKAINSIMTDKALDLMLKKLDKLGKNDNERIEVLEQSIMNSWKGIFELKGGGNTGTDNNQDKGTCKVEYDFSKYRG